MMVHATGVRYSIAVPVSHEQFEQAQHEMSAIEAPQVTHEITIGGHALPGRWYATAGRADWVGQERVYLLVYARAEI